MSLADNPTADTRNPCSEFELQDAKSNLYTIPNFCTWKKVCSEQTGTEACVALSDADEWVFEKTGSSDCTFRTGRNQSCGTRLNCSGRKCEYSGAVARCRRVSYTGDPFTCSRLDLYYWRRQGDQNQTGSFSTFCYSDENMQNECSLEFRD